MLGGAALVTVVIVRVRPWRRARRQPSSPDGDVSEEIPTADALDQQRVVGDAVVPVPPSTDPEAPEADAVEQAQPVTATTEIIEPSGDPEAPEADALEQATIMPADDERPEPDPST